MASATFCMSDRNDSPGAHLYSATECVFVHQLRRHLLGWRPHILRLGHLVQQALEHFLARGLSRNNSSISSLRASGCCEVPSVQLG